MHMNVLKIQAGAEKDIKTIVLETIPINWA